MPAWAVLEALLSCQEYKVGRFTLQPFRELLDGGVPVPVGRRALELLSVLAQAEGALVTKDELMAAVWPNTVVEDNALQVHVAALRKVLGRDAELLSTVHGLGYRLAAAPAGAAAKPKACDPPAEAPGIAAPRRRFLPPALALLSALCLGAAGVWFFRDGLAWPQEAREAKVAVLPFDTNGQKQEAKSFADSLLDEILGELSDNHIQAVSRADSEALRGPAARPAIDRLGADLLLDGTVQSDGRTIHVRLYLDDAREHVGLWSGEFQGSANAIEALRTKVAVQAADVLHWAKIGRSGKVRPDAASLAAFIAGRQSTTGVRNGSNVAALADYKKVVAAAPDFSWGHSGVAVTDAFLILQAPDSATLSKAALRTEAVQEARRALALEPHNGEAYLALEMVMPPLDWAKREALLVQGIAMDPNFEPGIMMEGRLLWAVGRGRDALIWLKQAHDLDPLHNGENWSLALNLADEGRAADSRALMAQMQRQWPGQMSTRDAQMWTDLATGATDDLVAYLSDAAARPFSIDQPSADAWNLGLKAIASHDPAAKAAAIKQVKETADTGSLARGHALTLLTMLGDLDGAFAQAELYQPINPYSAPHLFLSATAAMRADPRFMHLAQKFGFTAYWRATGHWPDFCSEPALPYDCRAEAAKADKLATRAVLRTRTAGP